MKKQLLWAALLFAAAFTSCSKNELKSVDASTAGKNQPKPNSVQPTYSYVDLILQPRQAGETYDTYKATWGSADIKLMGTPSWNTVKYPTLQNGVPAFGGAYAAYVGANSVDFNISGEEDIITVTAGSTPFFNFQAFHKDLGTFQDSLESWHKRNDPKPMPDTTSYPLIYNYVKLSYTDPNTPHLITTTGKLIRVTTGSHLAIATINYPLPKAQGSTATYPTFLGGVPHPENHNQFYHIFGTDGKITKINDSDCKSASGTYTATTNQFIFNVNVTIVKNDGTTVTYSGLTVDLS
ncbi:hypothetical protein [Mucilaginibacter celer]|uniref:Lipoprotein n=1 Tax=Mucilaginibacter celer TaxID=2305508 RepID=A0A494VVK4_9SPHI|nr:hypothetical protein [Mucilaginibacter celer]AYL98409.1 hypothetical protein HYN43_025360 [Mucilaginibacter celer]